MVEALLNQTTKRTKGNANYLIIYVMMRWLIHNSILILIYATFIVTGILYLQGFMNYRGVDSWPSVDAEIVGSGGRVISVPSQTRYGSRTSTIDSRFVVFRYSVDGQVYTSNKATPDGGGFPLNPMNLPWRAFYKPSSPNIAVLSPIPFQGIGLLVSAIFSGCIVIVHLWLTVPPLLTKNHKTES